MYRGGTLDGGVPGLSAGELSMRAFALRTTWRFLGALSAAFVSSGGRTFVFVLGSKLVFVTYGVTPAASSIRAFAPGLTTFEQVLSGNR